VVVDIRKDVAAVEHISEEQDSQRLAVHSGSVVEVEAVVAAVQEVEAHSQLESD